MSGNGLDVDGVFVVLAVVAQQGALADVQRQGHGATSLLQTVQTSPTALEQTRAVRDGHTIT